MTATVQTKKKFTEETGVSLSKLNELIKEGAIPLVPQEKSGGLVLINKLEFDRRVGANQFVIPAKNKKDEEEGEA
ncbi:hypothetical protein [Vibrio sp. HN007]|uniref:hypothetical protein n=1 Tax=Vibrio iocasae TaxID=3098914 RepID=UPI0035D4030A